MESLVVKNISCSYENKQILNNMSFTLKEGKIISILGASGCGKTTLLQVCANLLKQADGDIANSFKKSSFVFQEPHLLPWQSMLENISLPLKETGLSKTEIKLKASSVAIKLGLKEEDFKKFPKDLSGGMKQRVSLARALVVEPSLLFLDEPFSALDIGLKKKLYTILQKQLRQKSLSILFITHDLMEAVTLSDEVLIMTRGNKGSVISKKYEFEEDFDKRDNEFIYKHMLLLSDAFLDENSRGD